MPLDEIKKQSKYQVRVNVFQGKSFPAMDDNGLCDPYIKASLCGQEFKLKTLKKTRDPLFYETATFDVDLPLIEYLRFSPQVCLNYRY